MTLRKPQLEITGLKASYGNLQVLGGVDLAFPKGELVGIIGPSGSGKSTLIRALIGLTKPSAGTVSLDGSKVNYGNAACLRSFRDRVAVVFQQYNLFQNMSVIDNVTVTPIKIRGRPKEEARGIGHDLLASVGLADKKYAYPDELSGGQKQRVAIARALALDPEIILLDEVTAALDPELVRDVLDVIRGLSGRGISMLLVSHEMGFIREAAHRVVMMDQGKVVETGPPQQIFDDAQQERTKAFVSKIIRQ